MVDAFPLSFPPGWKRTPLCSKKNARFGTSFARARDSLMNELKLLGGTNIVLSSNIPLRRDGLPYGNTGQPADTGVAVYFTRKGKQQCVPCDKWRRVEDNVHAINLTIGALRGLDRWGANEMVDAAFMGFQQLEDKSHTSYFAGCRDSEERKKLYRELAKVMHPDNGGNTDEFVRMKQEYEQLGGNKQ